MNIRTVAKAVAFHISMEPLPYTPTLAAPGTPEKMAIMSYRGRMKQQLFHPADARYEGDTRPIEFLKRGLVSGTGLKAGRGLIESKYFGTVPPKKSKFFR